MDNVRIVKGVIVRDTHRGTQKNGLQLKTFNSVGKSFYITPQQHRSLDLAEDILEEYDITSTIKGPVIDPYNDFFLPNRSNLAAVILFPADHDPTFSFSTEDFSKRMYYMSREINIYGRRVRDLKQALEIMSEILISGCNIVHLELGGHGDGSSIRWPNYSITTNKDADQLKTLFDMLLPKSTVHLITCRGGGPIIDYLSYLGRGHRFIGVSCDLGPHLNLKVDKAYPLQVTYTTHQNKNVTVVKSFP